MFLWGSLELSRISPLPLDETLVENFGSNSSKIRGAEFAFFAIFVCFCKFVFCAFQRMCVPTMICKRVCKNKITATNLF